MRVLLPLEYYDLHDMDEIATAQTYSELLPVGFRVLRRMPDGAAMICGPISSGGTGSMAENIERFKRAIEVVARSSVPVFTQMPFEAAMQRIKDRGGAGSDASSLLTTFYRPLFESGRIKRLYFLPNWEGSFGARWEHEEALHLGMGIIYLPSEEFW